MGTDSTNSNTIKVGDQTFPFAIIDTTTGVTRIYDADGDSVVSLDAADMLELAEAVRDNQDTLRPLARAVGAQRRWDSAHSVVRNLITCGVRVRGMKDEYDLDRRVDFIEVTVADAQAIHDNAAGAEVKEDQQESPAYVITTTTCEVVPGVVLTHTHYENIQAAEQNDAVPA